MKKKELIKILKDQVLKAGTNILSDEKVPFRIRILGTVFIVLSGLLLYLDKFLAVLNIESEYTFGYSKFSNFIWAFTQSIAPIFTILGVYLKPYKASFLIAIYCYGLQLIWIFSAEHSDDFLGHMFAIGICVLFMIIVFIIKSLINNFGRKKTKEEEFVTEAKDVLEMLKVKVLESNRI